MGTSCLFISSAKPQLLQEAKTLISPLTLPRRFLLKMDSMQSWVSKHKLESIGTLWASAVGASLAYNSKRSPLKPSLRLIHARIHAQALTLAVLCGAAIKHYYDVEN